MNSWNGNPSKVIVGTFGKRPQGQGLKQSTYKDILNVSTFPSLYLSHASKTALSVSCLGSHLSFVLKYTFHHIFVLKMLSGFLIFIPIVLWPDPQATKPIWNTFYPYASSWRSACLPYLLSPKAVLSVTTKTIFGTLQTMSGSFSGIITLNLLLLHC